MANTFLDNKISSFIEDKFPEFIRTDHPVFVEFLRLYYQFLETAKSWRSETIDERDLIIYIDLLYSLSNGGNEDDEQFKELFEQTTKVNEMEKKVKQLVKKYENIEILNTTPEEKQQLKGLITFCEYTCSDKPELTGNFEEMRYNSLAKTFHLLVMP